MTQGLIEISRLENIATSGMGQELLKSPEIDTSTVYLLPRFGRTLPGEKYYFPEGTMDFSDFLADNLIIAEIVTRDEDYLELSLNSDKAKKIIPLILVPSMTVLYAILGTAGGNLISEYIMQNGSSTARIEIVVKQEKESYSINYNGPADEFASAASKLVNSIQENGRLQDGQKFSAGNDSSHSEMQHGENK